MSDKKIVVNGKEFDYGDMSDEVILKLYDKLLERQVALQKLADENNN